VRLPDGNTAKREIVDHNGSVCIVALHEGNVYFVRQFRYATGESLLELPAGTLNSGEDAETCARREIREEIGFSAERMTFLFEGYVSPGYSGELQRYFLAEGLRPAPAAADDDEFLDVETMAWPEALERVGRGEFRDTKTVAGLLCAARLLESGENR
jgi:ADP-ribose pyrophosphatase